jgi:acylaminoacyl-peptidase
VRRVDTGTEITAAGEMRPLAISWSPEGNWIAFTARTAVSPPAWAPKAILPRLRMPEGSVEIFVVPAAGGMPRQVTKGDFGCVDEPSWTLDQQSVVAARGGASIDSVRISDGAVKPLTTAAGRYRSPVVSPDGGRIAYLVADAAPRSYFVHRVAVMNADGSRPKTLTGGLDRDAKYPQWSSESRTVYFIADDRGETHVYAARNDGTVRQATNAAERLEGFSLADNGRAASVRSSASEAGDVVTFTVDSVSQPVTVASPNGELLAEREIGLAEMFEYPSDGKTIQARVVKPARFEGGQRYPLLLDIQDEPRQMCGVEFSVRAQIFAARGFVVLCANARGTPGYGEQFGALLPSRLPGDDYDDLMRGVDALLAKGYIDPRRLVVSGGLLAAWAIGHTDRFAAAVARRPVVNWATHVAQAPDGMRRAVDWMGSMPWDDPDQYTKRSPVFFAKNFQTPTLILAGEGDAGSEELYFALRARKVKAALVRLGDEASNLETMLAWMGQF